MSSFFSALKKFQQIFAKNLSIWVTVTLKRQENMHCVNRRVQVREIFGQTRTWNLSMILTGQHSVSCFRYAPMGMLSKSIQYQIPRAKQVAWTFSLTNRLEWFLLLSFDVLGSELPWNCIIKHRNDNYHKVVPFLLIHIVLFVRIMRDYAEICKLCDRMRFFINSAGSHYRTERPCSKNSRYTG